MNKKLCLSLLLTALSLNGCLCKTMDMNANKTDDLHHDFFSYSAAPDKGYQVNPAISGTLVKNNFCILFEGEDGLTYTPLFPFEMTEYDKENNRMVLGGVPIDFGQYFTTGGFESEWSNKLKFVTTSDQSCFRERPVILDVGVNFLKK